MAGLLEQIKGPEDIKGLSYKELEGLAKEIRRLIIDTVNRTGGHMASNLGVVELTIALHRVFDSPRDRLVYDTSNQCYTHKLLTGRVEQFQHLRQPGGLSGFGEPKESEHDVVAAGHAGAGLSLAQGIAAANQLEKNGRFTVCVVGDGALTAGLSYEALNNIVHQAPPNLIVILNDNGMSISENVGWLNRWRDSIIGRPQYESMVRRAKRAAKRLPKGEFVYRMVQRAKQGLESFILPSMIWEEMGFRYIGPVDGHDLRALEKALASAKKMSDKPPFIHIITHKGRGYEPAQDDPVKFHQPSSPLGSGKDQAPTYSAVFANTVIKLMEKDQRVVAISAAMLEGTALVNVKERFPDRVFDVGVAEQHAVTMAAGLAKQGYRPFVAIYSTFLQRAFDQILHDVCLNKLPVAFAVDRAGLVGEDGKTHQGIFDIAYMRCIPNIILSAPKDEAELRHLVYTAYKSDLPFAFRIPRGAGLGVPMGNGLEELPIGKGETLRHGDDIALLAYGYMAPVALKAAELLEEDGIECAVANARFAKPLDADLLSELSGVGKGIVTLEEHLLMGGFGSAVAEELARMGKGERLLSCIGLPDEFIEHGPRANLLQQYNLTPEGVARRVKSLLPNGAFSRRKLALPAGSRR